MYHTMQSACYFYPRPPRGGRRHENGGHLRSHPISIHALREEGDAGWGLTFDAVNEFLSTPSARRATQGLLGLFDFDPHISIHALREEGDRVAVGQRIVKRIISIHALREEGDSKNREKTPCFCLIIHLSAQIAKRCLQTKPQNHTVTCANGWYSGAKRPGKPCVLPVRTGRTSKDQHAVLGKLRV